MSRCFPFPPPGYEKKSRNDDVDSLLKEKDKEKKHRKERRDKKKEGKEKEKDRSKDKHQEKKEQKEKDKDKKKSKDKKKLDENHKEGEPDGYSVGKLSENSQQAEAIKDTSFLEFGRSGDEERGRRDQMVEKFGASDQRKEDGRDRLGQRDQIVENFHGSDQRKVDCMARLGQRAEMVESSHASTQRKEDGMARLGQKEQIVESYRAIAHRKEDGMARLGQRDQMAENFRASKEDGMARLGQKDNDTRAQGKENNKDKNGHEKKTDKQRIRDEGRLVGNPVVPGVSGAEQRSAGGMPRITEKDVEKKLDGKEKGKDQVGNDEQGGKHKHKDREKKSKDKKVKEKEKKEKKEKKKEKIKFENTKPDKMIEVPKDHIHTRSIKPIQIPKDSKKSSAMEESLRKRKECETNGFLHDNDDRPNKLPRATSSSHPVTGNGRKPELSHSATQSASDVHGGANNLRLDHKEHKINGLTQALPTSIGPTSSSIPPVHQSASAVYGGTNNFRLDNKEHKINGLTQALPTSIGSKSSSFPPVQASENGEAFTKPPHPDAKYLSQILSVPKMDDWSDFDDQEWLFSNDSLQVKKPKMVSSEVDGSTQVWDRALWIDSVDVCALPYVNPY